MKISQSLGVIGSVLCLQSMAWGYALDGVELTGRGPFQDAGTDYINFEALAGRSLTDPAGHEFTVIQGASTLYRGFGPYVLPAITNKAESVVIAPLSCRAKYGCSASLVHLAQPQLITGLSLPAGAKIDTLYNGQHHFRGLGLRGRLFTVTAPNGQVFAGGDAFPVNGFSATINQVGQWQVTVTGTPFMGSETVTLSKTYNVYPERNLGAEFFINQVALEAPVTLSVSQWSNWNWQPTHIEVGIGVDDGRPLDGVTVTDEQGNAVPLTGWYGKVAQRHTGSAKFFTIKSATPRVLSIKWWATTTPNVVDLAAPHTKYPVDASNSTSTLQISQWANLGYMPAAFGIGFTANDGQPLDGLWVEDKTGKRYALSGWWTAINLPFSFEPVQLIVPNSGRKLNVEWWGAGL